MLRPRLSCAFVGLALAIHSTVLAEGVALEPPAQRVFQQMVAWSPDGATLAYSEMEITDEGPGPMSLKTVDLESGDVRIVAEDAVYGAWSPDGRHIATTFLNRDQPESAAIWVVGVETEERRQLTPGEKRDIAPAWSPDGNLIVYTSGDRESMDLLMVEAHGGEPRAVTTNEHRDFNPDWSPDGSRIVFYREKGDQKDQIHTIAPDGTDERRVTDGTTHNFYPSFIPDGRIAYTLSGQETGGHLMTIGVDGGVPTKLALPHVSYARWSPDGSTIAFVAGRFPGTAIYLADADGSNVRKVVN